jgi:hypothetical protein
MATRVRTHFLTVAAIALSAAPALATSDGDLRTALEQRFKGDRTGACVAAAVIDNGTTATAYVCAMLKPHARSTTTGIRDRPSPRR